MLDSVVKRHLGDILCQKGVWHILVIFVRYNKSLLTLIMFYKGQSLRDARRNFVKNKGQGLALRAGIRDSKNWIW